MKLHIAAYGSTNIQTNITPLVGVFRVLGSAYKGVKKITGVITTNKNVDATYSTGYPEDITATAFGNFWSADTATNGCIKKS